MWKNSCINSPFHNTHEEVPQGQWTGTQQAILLWYLPTRFLLPVQSQLSQEQGPPGNLWDNIPLSSLSFCHKLQEWNETTFKVTNLIEIDVDLVYLLIRNSHKKTLLNEELSYKCGVCGELFWSIHERTVHISQTHKEESGNLSKCKVCDHISPNRHALR